MIRDSGAITVKHALLALAGVAVGLPAMAALASIDGQPTGGLPARYVPWIHASRRIHTETLDTPAPTARTTPAAPLAGTTRRREARPRPPTRRVPPYRRPGATPARHPWSSPPARPRAHPPPARGRRGSWPPPSGLGGLLSPRRDADLRVSITAPAVVRPRGTFSYTVRLANRGPGTPGAVTVRSLLPAGVVRTGSWLPDGVGGYAGGRDATLVLGRLAPGRSMTARFRVRVRPRVRGDLLAWSGIVYAGGVRDRRPKDNTATAITRVRRRA